MLKRNKMLFGQKSEKGKYICDGQLTLDGGVFNEAEAESNPAAEEQIKSVMPWNIALPAYCRQAYSEIQ